MKKEFFTGLAAMVLAIGFVLVGCESPTNGSNGGSGANALPAVTATTVEGAEKFFADGHSIVYFAGALELPVSGGADTLTIPEGKALILADADDLQSRGAAPKGSVGITLSGGGTLNLNGTARLRVKDGTSLTLNGGVFNASGTSFIAFEKDAVFATPAAVTGINPGAVFAFEDPADLAAALPYIGALNGGGASAPKLAGGDIDPATAKDAAQPAEKIEILPVATSGVITYNGKTLVLGADWVVKADVLTLKKGLYTFSEHAHTLNLDTGVLSLYEGGTLTLSGGAAIGLADLTGITAGGFSKLRKANVTVGTAAAATAINGNLSTGDFTGTITFAGGLSALAASDHVLTIGAGAEVIIPAGKQLVSAAGASLVFAADGKLTLGAAANIAVTGGLTEHFVDTANGVTITSTGAAAWTFGGSKAVGIASGDLVTVAPAGVSVPDISFPGALTMTSVAVDFEGPATFTGAATLVDAAFAGTATFEGEATLTDAATFGSAATFADDATLDVAAFNGDVTFEGDVELTGTDDEAAAYIFSGNVLIPGKLTASGESDTTIEVKGTEFRFADAENTTVAFNWTTTPVTFDFTGGSGGDIYLPRTGGMGDDYSDAELTFRNCTVYRNNGDGYNISSDFTFDNATLALSAALVNKAANAQENDWGAYITLKNGGSIAASAYSGGDFAQPTKVLSAGPYDARDTTLRIKLVYLGHDKAVFTPVFDHKLTATGSTDNNYAIANSGGGISGIKLGPASGGLYTHIKLEGAPVIEGLLICGNAGTEDGGGDLKGVATLFSGGEGVELTITNTGTLYEDENGWIEFINSAMTTTPEPTDGAATIYGTGTLVYKKNGGTVFTAEDATVYLSSVHAARVVESDAPDYDAQFTSENWTGPKYTGNITGDK